MLDVLLESKAQHTRRVGGTLASALVHGAIITGAVLLTVQRPYTTVKDTPPPVIHFLPIEPQADAPPAPRPATTPEAPANPNLPNIPILPIAPVAPAVTQVGPTPITPGDLSVGTMVAPTGALGGPTSPSGSGTEAIEARLVDKPPRVLRSENPRFPEALRARGQNGRIVVQFVVDTLGRAEMSEFKVVDATDPQLADPVRAVLPRFRFTPGEAAGRKVRTMVALPFDFTLVR
jgi:protein TonB